MKWDQQSLSRPVRVAIVVSRFNETITERLLAGALGQAEERNLTEPDVVWVPGAVEIPLIAQRLARSKQYDALVCLGAVIRGETTHYDYVCAQVSEGCQRVMLDHDIPVIFGVLTTEDEAQALARTGGAHGHKGEEAIDAAIHMISLCDQLG